MIAKVAVVMVGFLGSAWAVEVAAAVAPAAPV
jgi:hypothetical protein